VTGSRFPQRVTPLVGWPGYGISLTAAALFVLRGELDVGSFFQPGERLKRSQLFGILEKSQCVRKSYLQ
jgi:hypothetical protein